MHGVFVDDCRLLVLEHPPAVSPCDLVLHLRLASLSAFSIAYALQASLPGMHAHVPGPVVSWGVCPMRQRGRAHSCCAAAVCARRDARLPSVFVVHQRITRIMAPLPLMSRAMGGAA